MNKNLESEYQNMIRAEVPDIWNKIEAKIDAQEAQKKGLRFSFGSGVDSEITVYLPEAAYTKLSVEENTGDVAIPKDFSFEQINITATTGDVRCSASALGEVRIIAGTGDILLQDMRAVTLDLSVSTGKVTLEHIPWAERIRISVSTGKTVLSDVKCISFFSEGSTGDVYLTNVIADNSISVTRSTGDIKLDSCDSSSSVDLHTTTGSIKGTLLTPKYFQTNTTTGRVAVPENFGADAICRISTTTGDIKIEVIH